MGKLPLPVGGGNKNSAQLAEIIVSGILQAAIVKMLDKVEGGEEFSGDEKEASPTAPTTPASRENTAGTTAPASRENTAGTTAPASIDPTKVAKLRSILGI